MLYSQRKNLFSGLSIVSSRANYSEKQISATILPFIAANLLAYIILYHPVSSITLNAVWPSAIIGAGISLFAVLNNLIKGGKLGLVFASGIGLFCAALLHGTMAPMLAGPMLVSGILISLILFVLKDQTEAEYSLNRFVFAIFSCYLLVFQNYVGDIDGFGFNRISTVVLGFSLCSLTSLRYRSTVTFLVILLFTLIAIGIEIASAEAYAVGACIVLLMLIILTYTSIKDMNLGSHSSLRQASTHLLMLFFIFAIVAFLVALTDAVFDLHYLWLVFFCFAGIVIFTSRPSKSEEDWVSPVPVVSILTVLDLVLIINLADHYDSRGGFSVWLPCLVLSLLARVLHFRKHKSQFGYLFHHVWIFFIFLIFVGLLSDNAQLNESSSGTLTIISLYAIAVSAHKKPKLKKELPWWSGFASPRIAISMIRGYRAINEWLARTKLSTPFVIVFKIILNILAFIKSGSRKFELRDISLMAVSTLLTLMFCIIFENPEIQFFGYQGYLSNIATDTRVYMIAAILMTIIFGVFGNLFDVLMVKYFAIFAAVTPIALLLFSYADNGDYSAVFLTVAAFCGLFVAALSFLFDFARSTKTE